MSTTTLQQVPAGTYSLDPVHSTFGFAVKHMGIGNVRGENGEDAATTQDQERNAAIESRHVDV